MIERELIVLKVLRGAPNVVQLVGLGWEIAPVNGDSRLWPVLVLEYADQSSLANLQAQVSRLPYGVKRKLCLDVAPGLHSLHHAGLIRGHLKNENVLIFGATQDHFLAKLSDFAFAPVDCHLKTGVASGNDGRGTLCPSLLGATELWSPPELLESGDHAALAARDAYSWGLLVLRVVIDGQNPFKIPPNLTLKPVEHDQVKAKS
jgi:serine/threonine protein kinase